MNEYVDVDIIENGKVIGTTKVLHVTKEPETQNIKLEKVDAKTAYDNLLVKYAELEKEIRLLGERCNQLLKDKGELTDKLQELKETLAQTIENDEVDYETLKLHDQEEIGMLNSKVTELGNKITELNMKIDGLEEQNSYMFDTIDLQEQQIEKMKNGDNCKYGCMACGNYICELGLENCNTIPFHCYKWEIKEND